MLKLTMRRLSTRICAIWQKVEDSICISAAKLLTTSAVANRITITNRCEYADGAGAQVQRILSIIALAKYFRFTFMLNPINKVEVQPLDHISSELILKKDIALLNSWIGERFEVNTNENLRDYRLIGNSREFFTMVFSVFLAGFFTNKSKTENLMFTDAYFLTIRKPNVWNLILPHADIRADNVEAQKDYVAHIHLRLSTFSSSSDRYIPINYYKNIMDTLVSEAVRNAINIRFVIHTDFNSPITETQFFLKNATPQSLEYWVDLGLLKSNYEVDLETVNAARDGLNQLLLGYENAHISNEKTWSSEWESMASADWLVVSKSSFSLIGALLNKSGVIFVPKSWGPALPSWIQQKY